MKILDRIRNRGSDEEDEYEPPDVEVDVVECYECGDPEEWGVVESGDGWEVELCWRCSDRKEATDAKIREFIHRDNRPVFQAYEEEDAWEVTHPDEWYRRYSGSREDVIEELMEKWPDHDFAIRWENGYTICDRGESATWIFQEPDPREPRFPEDVTEEAETPPVDILGAAGDKGNYQMVSEYDREWRPHDVFDDGFVEWMPVECPECGMHEPSRFMLHETQSGTLVEHRHSSSFAESCNNIIGILETGETDQGIEDSPDIVDEDLDTGTDTQDLLDEVDELL